jgi:hypothetical protein
LALREDGYGESGCLGRRSGAAAAGGRAGRGRAVALRKVKYDALAKYLATLKGKVIVVDFWATY